LLRHSVGDKEASVIDHTSVVVSDFAKSKQFYGAVLKPIGYELLMEFPAAVTGHTDVAGFGERPKPDFWISQGTPDRATVHVAFRVSVRSLVDAFYAAALAAGGRDNGQPGLRPQYHPHYYGAFVLDPDGHNIEVVCHEAE
jgi:catechol 2,3-dioxygenase-like lactoylglutathione lyase family enzyme